MGFPYCPPTEEEIAERARIDRIHDEKINVAKKKADGLRKQLKVSPSVDKHLPDSAQRWLRKRLNPEDLLEDLKEAEVDHQWTIYDKSRARRQLYPRKRAISPDNKAFNPRKQTYRSDQTQSLLFKLLPPELRVEVYRALFGRLIVQIDGSHGGFNGPPPSRDHMVFRSSRITTADGHEFVKGITIPTKDATKFTPHILPLLQTCRQIYAEAIPILYSEFVFKSHSTSNDVYWSKYLLKPRLETIRTAHFQLALGYPWEAACHRYALEALAAMKGLRKLCLLGRSQGMVDCVYQNLITQELWVEKKHLFLQPFRDLLFIKEVDIFLPIRREILAKNDEEKLGHIRIHGLTEEESTGQKAVYCACKYFREKMQIFH